MAVLARTRGEPLLQALEEELPGSRAHADAAAAWALAVAVELGLGRERCLGVREAARLQDVGRVYIPEELATRPFEELSDEEARRVESHAEAGSRLAEGAGVPAQACVWIRHSRERFDGDGVPDGLAGGAIPVESRIIRAASAFDIALDRVAQAAEPPADPQAAAVEMLRGAAGAELDPQAVDALARVVARAGSG